MSGVVDRTRRHGTLWCSLFALFFLALVLPASAKKTESNKTDVVYFKNGDRLTGEVKKLERGKLSFKTDATDTIQIEWEDVASVISERHFDVVVESGEKFFGSLAAVSGERQVEIAGDQQSSVLDLASVVRLTPIEESFLKRLDGSLDFGFSFTESDDRTQLSFSTEVEYHTRRLLRRATFNSIVASQSGVDETDRYDLNLFLLRDSRRRPKLGTFGLASFQHNNELGLDLRSLVGAGASWRPIQTNNRTLTVIGGLSVSRENLDGATDDQESLESILGFQFQSFRFDTPERDITFNLAIYPNLSDFGRVRAELDAKIRWEIFRDYFVSLSLLESWDSDPPTEDAEKSDLTVITSLGWTF